MNERPDAGDEAGKPDRPEKLDITTKAGLLRALEVLADDKHPINQTGPVNRFISKKVHQFLSDTLKTTESTLEQQRKTAVDIIRQGKESGADSVEITLDQQVGLHFGSSVDGFPIKATMGKSGNMTIKVIYK
jgi:hypothetical protein